LAAFEGGGPTDIGSCPARAIGVAAPVVAAVARGMVTSAVAAGGQLTAGAAGRAVAPPFGAGAVACT
jgi:hypothetical protein